MRPLRLTILHFAQRFFTDADTFMVSLLQQYYHFAQRRDYTASALHRPGILEIPCDILHLSAQFSLLQSQDYWPICRNGNCVFKMCGQ